jgi:hypothetical protein
VAPHGRAAYGRAVGFGKQHGDMALPGDAWEYWSVDLPDGGVLAVMGAGPCHAQTAFARMLPDGSWFHAPTAPEAVATAAGVDLEQGRALFLAG